MKQFIKKCFALVLAVSAVVCSVCSFSASAVFDKTKELYNLTQDLIREFANGSIAVGATEYYGSIAYAIQPYSDNLDVIQEGYILFNRISDFGTGVTVTGSMSFVRLYDSTGSKPSFTVGTSWNETTVQYFNNGSLWLPIRGEIPYSRVIYFSMSDYHFSDSTINHAMIANPLQSFPSLPSNMLIPNITDVPFLQSLKEISSQFEPVPPTTLPPYTVPTETIPSFSGGLPEYWIYYQAEPIETIEPPTAFLPDVEISTFNVPDNIIQKTGFWWDLAKWFFDSFSLWWLVGLAVAFTLISIIFF